MTSKTADSSPPLPRRRWLRFSLRTLLLATAAVAVWLGVQVNRATNQRRAVSLVKDLGGKLHYLHQGYTHPVPLNNLYSSSTFDPNAQQPGPAWLRRFLGDEYFQDVVYIDLAERVASEGDADAKLIAALPRLEYLDMGLCNLTDEALRHFSGVRTLRVLHVERNKLTDEGLQHLARATKLESLNIAMIHDIRRPGLRHLIGLKALKELDLQYVQLDCDWLKELSGLPLDKLMLAKTPLEDAHLTHVGQITSVVVLSIDRTNITAAGLAHLTSLKNLQQLYVNEIPALEAVEHLRQLPSLIYLGIDLRTQTTATSPFSRNCKLPCRAAK